MFVSEAFAKLLSSPHSCQGPVHIPKLPLITRLKEGAVTSVIIRGVEVTEV